MIKNILPNEKIYIAGHSGMVGSAIKRKLINRGYSNLLCPNRQELDLLDFNQVEKWFKDNIPDVVILAAAKVGGINANDKFSADFILENLKIQNNVIENAWKHKARRFLFLGSSCIYPRLTSQPMKEEYLLTGKLEKTNEAYAVAKIAGIQLCNALKKQYGFDAISLMPTNLYGQGDNYNPSNSHVLPAMISKFYQAKIKGINKVSCWGSGTPRREFLFVDDLADALIFILENVSINNSSLFDDLGNFSGILNVGVGSDITIKELANLISSIIGYDGEIIWDSSKPDGTPRKLLEVSKLKKLGWSAKTNLQKGIELTYKSYLEELKSKKARI